MYIKHDYMYLYHTMRRGIFLGLNINIKHEYKYLTMGHAININIKHDY